MGTLPVATERGAVAAPAKSTALLVALGDGVKGKSALQIWSDFVSSTQRPVTADTAIQQGNFDRDCGGGSGGSVVSGLGREGDGRSKGDEGWPREKNASQSLFPPVWILTSDPEVDKTIREGMPHLSSFFVPGALGNDAGGDGDGDSKNYEELPSWSDVLDRFLSENPGVDMFGIFGENAMPTAALLPYFIVSDSASSDAPSSPAVATAGCGGGGRSSGGGCAIESVLWPVLSKSMPPTAVVSRARAWWVDERVEKGADEGRCGSRGRVGDWMPDKFVAQVRSFGRLRPVS